jgi:hypothetical protein
VRRVRATRRATVRVAQEDAENQEVEVAEEAQPSAAGRLTQTQDNVIPASWPFTALLARTDDVALGVVGGDLYREFFEFRLILLHRITRPRDDFDHGRAMSMLGSLGAGSVLEPDQILRFGLRFSDGRVWTNLDAADLHEWPPVRTDPDAIQLVPTSGTGGERRWEQTLQLGPLPPDGPITLICEWPAYGISETSVSIDMTGLRAAAEQVTELWPYEPEKDDWSPPPKLRFGEKGDAFFRPILGHE